MDNKEILPNTSEVSNKPNTVEAPAPSSIVLPDIKVPEAPQHVPTVEELEAQRKKEEEQRIKEKQENHAKNFNASEQVLYTVEEEKEGNPLVVVAFFIVLVIFIFALPKMSKQLGSYFTSIKNPGTTAPVASSEEETLHRFNDAQNRVSIGNLDLTNFVKSYQNNEYELNFTIINNSTDTYTYNKKYYVVMYEDKKIIYRALIHSYSPLASKAAQELSLVISKRAYESANAFTLEEITIGQYPNVNITATSNEYALLTCTHNNDTVEYYFEEDMLVKIKETYQEELENNTNYIQDKNKYQTLAVKYNTIPGMTSTFVETPRNFTQITEFALKDIQDRTLSDLETYKFFKFRERSKVVVFENTAMGYTCDNNS